MLRAYATHLQTTQLPPYLYISHNHTDHAGELPVVAAVARRQGINLLAHHRVLPTLLQHRLHELQSTGLPVDAFVTPHPLREGVPFALSHGLSLEPVLAQHSEPCYGLLLRRHGQAIVGWTVRATPSTNRC